MTSYGDIRDRLEAKYRFQHAVEQVAETAGEGAAPVDPLETAFVVEPGNGSLYLTSKLAPFTLDYDKANYGPKLMRIQGRYVQAGKPNQNNAYFSTGDLEWGQPTVAMTPVNLLHDRNKIVGCIESAKMVYDAGQLGTHMVTDQVVWAYLYPEVADMLAKASQEGKLYQSMEAVAEKVECVSGCGEQYDYAAWKRDPATGCDHLARGGTRRLVNPTFIGTGLIYAPFRPAWADASASWIQENASANISDSLINVVAQITEWAGMEPKV
jgi:hypothetical protein